ncbi:hypothetical protein D5086_008194 [Populus alba]|uniref:Uncharacterized protein n=1 Tax=Populus alba TaxID=43335 RepID=A0ACC4CG25_POPAL
MNLAMTGGDCLDFSVGRLSYIFSNKVANSEEIRRSTAIGKTVSLIYIHKLYLFTPLYRFVKPDRSPEQNAEILANFGRRRLLEKISTDYSSSDHAKYWDLPCNTRSKRRVAQSPVTLDSPVNPPTIGAKRLAVYLPETRSDNHRSSEDWSMWTVAESIC